MARRKTIKPIDLSAAIQEILTEYGDEVYDVLGKAVDEVSKEAVQKLQAANHFASGGHPTGAYAKDWTADDVPTGRLTQKRVVHNEDHYRLAHLLEKGHVSRNGTGRTFGRVSAYPHIKPVEEWAQKELPRKVEEMIRTI